MPLQEGGGGNVLNVTLTGESNAPSCFKHSSSPTEQGTGAEPVDGAD